MSLYNPPEYQEPLPKPPHTQKEKRRGCAENLVWLIAILVIIGVFPFLISRCTPEPDESYADKGKHMQEFIHSIAQGVALATDPTNNVSSTTPTVEQVQQVIASFNVPVPVTGGHPSPPSPPMRVVDSDCWDYTAQSFYAPVYIYRTVPVAIPNIWCARVSNGSHIK